MKKKLKIAQVAPLWLPIPPEKYGGIEWIIYHLTEKLKERGHDVTLFASGDSKTSAKLISLPEKSLLKAGLRWNFFYYDVYNLITAIKKANDFDIIHTHIDLVDTFFADFTKTPLLHTIHNPLCLTYRKTPTMEHRLFLFNKFKNNNYVAISNSQKNLCPYKINFTGTVYNGINIKDFELNLSPEDYFLWAARIDKYKGIENAIEIAERTGIKLILAGKLEKTKEKYFKEKIKPRLNEKIKFIGEYSREEKQKILGDAKAFLYPILWEEPFGLVMIESMACGTPVIAFKRGSVPEVIKDKKTGFVVNNIDEAVEAVKKIDTIKREDCRAWVEEKFTVEKMVDGYEEVYNRVINRK